MDPILEEVYSIIVPSAPYVIGAYALIWVVLLVFVIIMLVSTKKTQKAVSYTHLDVYKRQVLDPAGATVDVGTFAGIDCWGRATVRAPDGREMEFSAEQASLRPIGTDVAL